MRNEKTINSSTAGAQQNVPLAALFGLFAKLSVHAWGKNDKILQLMEAELVGKRLWIGKPDWDHLAAMAQDTPGILRVNLSAHIGYRLQKTKGAIVAVSGIVLPSLAIMLLIALLFHALIDVPFVAAMFRGIRPAVVALVAAPTFSLAKKAKITFTNCWIPLFTAFLIWALGVNPIWILLVAGICGYAYGKFIMPIE